MWVFGKLNYQDLNLITYLLLQALKLQCYKYICPINQISREINSLNSRSAKTALFAILRAVNFVPFGKVQPLKVQKFLKSKFRASKCVKMADFALQESSKLISRKKSDRKITKFL